MTLAGRFFRERELNDELEIDSAETLWFRLVHELVCVGVAPSGSMLPMFYRGQQNADWGLKSSLYRACMAARPGRPVTEDVMRAAEAATLLEARAHGLGRWMTEAQLLMVLQHHGCYTRLIDVSEGLQEALYFAVEDGGADGRLFLLRPSLIAASHMDVPREDVLRVGGVVALPWPDDAGAAVDTVPAWDERIGVTDRPGLDARMFAQRGRLLAGGMPSAASGRTMQVEGVDLPEDQWAEITTLGFDFPMSGELPRGNWAGSGWTIRIAAAWKSQLLDYLANWTYPVTRESIYPPIEHANIEVNDATEEAAAAV